MDLLNRIFQPDMEKRITVHELINHPWLAEATLAPDVLQGELGRRHAVVRDSKTREMEKEKEEKARRQAARGGAEEREYDPFAASTYRSIAVATCGSSGGGGGGGGGGGEFGGDLEGDMEGDMGGGGKTADAGDGVDGHAAPPMMAVGGGAYATTCTKVGGGGGGGGGVRRFTTPLYTQASPSTIQDRLAQALSQMSAEYRLKDASPHTVKATVMVPGGRVEIKLQTYQVNAQTDGGAAATTAAAAAAGGGGGGAVCLSTTRTAPLFAVQILRQRGSILQFQEVYRALCDQLDDIVALPPTQGCGEGGGGSGDDGGGDGGNAQDAAAGGAAARGIDRMSLK